MPHIQPFPTPWCALKQGVPLPLQDSLELRRSVRVYRLAAPFVALLLVPGFLRRMMRRGGYQDHFGQRLGWFTPAESQRLQAGRWSWIRSISVGETLVALKLARALRAEDPSVQIALSVTTSTGYALAAKEATDWLFVFYNPVDTQAAVGNVLNLLRPQRLVLVEGEIWPNLMIACHERGVPVMLANARLSTRSARSFARFQRWTSPFFRMLRWVGIPDEDDRDRWLSTGVRDTQIELTGSIKFDHEVGGDSKTDSYRALLLQSGFGEEAPLLVAGSTHDGEEEILVRSLVKWRQKHPALRLAIAPRHVERVPKLLKALAPLGFRTVLRSALPTQEPWDVLLLDTTGELRDWYGLATVVFVGKSLTAEGGQNPVEPALAGRAVLFGPHMENFEAVVKLLLEAHGARQVGSEEELVSVTSQWLDAPELRAEMGRHALTALGGHQGSARRTARRVLETVAIG